jgi:squalene-hopene/tetraprenyl-beta-curcumene cyclase
MLSRLRSALDSARAALLAERNAGGWWEGRLSSSALSTATASIALLRVDHEVHRPHALRGLGWLADTQCAGGGWGDTPESLPNLSTTLLCRAAFGLAGDASAPWQENVRRCDAWITQTAGGNSPAQLTAALEARYGKDKTFSVPILMACALGGLLGPPPECWRRVPQLPFELAALPRQLFAALKLPVVSYALPALIAIGQVRFHHVRGNALAALWRSRVAKKTLHLLREIQPDGGGFLEAVPLTSFVTMALADMGRQMDPVVREAAGFLLRSARRDGSWPIDTNLATWVTTLSVKALVAGTPPSGGNILHGPPDASIPPEPKRSEDSRGQRGTPAIRQWLLSQQYRTTHPYTLSPAGGWAWTDLPGGVPDADDTAGALLALQLLGEPDNSPAALRGVQWLLGLQNRDGGIPTFCRGWGTLPFDRSTPEITAHALAALHAWRTLPEPRIAPAMNRMLQFLRRSQNSAGSWEPLWFGNEHAPFEANPVYGTATVLKYLASIPGTEDLRRRAADFLIRAQCRDGAWSGAPGELPPSIEETALALEALARHGASDATLQRGADALLHLTEDGTRFPPAPIGLYFARLWYHEKLYPLIAATAAFGALCALTQRSSCPPAAEFRQRL